MTPNQKWVFDQVNELATKHDIRFMIYGVMAPNTTSITFGLRCDIPLAQGPKKSMKGKLMKELEIEIDRWIATDTN